MAKLACGIALPGNIDVQLPDVLFAAVGHPIEIYYDSLLAGKTDSFFVHVDSVVGNSYKRKWSFTPNSSNIGLHAITVNIYKNDGQVIASKTATINVAGADTAGVPGKLKLLCIGDSNTNGVFNNSTLRNYLNTLAAADYGAEKFEFVGTQGTAPYKHEGYDGYNTNNFAVNLSSPFVNASGVLDFSYYTTNTGITPDVVHILLGTNDVTLETITAETAATNIIKMTERILVDWPDAFVYVSPVFLPGDQNAWGGAASTSDTGRKAALLKDIKTQKIASLLCGNFNEKAYEQAFISPAFFCFDRANSYKTETVPVNPFNAATEVRQTDARHPTTYGMQQVLSLLYGTWNGKHPTDGSAPTGTTLTNLINNADFSDGTNNWTSSGGVSLSAAGGEITMVSTAETATTGHYLLSKAFKSAIAVGHKVYARCTCKTDLYIDGVLNTATYTQNPFRPLTSAAQAVGATLNRTGTNQREFLTMSEIFETTAVASIVRSQIIVASSLLTGTATTIKEVMIIDLTAAYGAGNEPDKAYLDALPFFANTITV